MQLDPEMVNLSISACLKFLTQIRAARTSDESRTIRLILTYFNLAVSSFSDMIAVSYRPIRFNIECYLESLRRDADDFAELQLHSLCIFYLQ